MPFCPKCGTEVPENVNFCQKCGNALQGMQSPSQSSNAVANADTEFGETKRRNFRNIVKGCALLLCVLFFACPLVKCTQDSSLTASGWELATGTGDLGRGGGNPLVFALIVFPAVLLILAFMNKPFIVLRNASIAGLAAKILFIIAVYAKLNSGDYVSYKHAFELTVGNWFILSIYIGLVWLTQYCVNFISEIKKAVAIPPAKKGSFTDPRDNKTYKTVKIGDQTWMAENLAYECEGSKCCGNDQKYGRLYDWETAKKACPPGWHLPSNAEWQVLVNFAGGDKEAGTMLKASSGWNQNGNGTDAIGFAALPGGYGGSVGGFSNVGYGGYWWSSSEDNSDTAYIRGMIYNYENVYYYGNVKSSLFSVRCVQD